MEVKDAIAIYVENARFRGSKPLTGLFQIYNEGGIWRDEKGIYHAEVICSWHGTDRDIESLILDLEAYPDHVIIGLDDDEVIAAIG